MGRLYTGHVHITDNGETIYKGPAFVRCTQFACQKIVTDGYIAEHGKCYCGNHKLIEATALTPEEEEGLLRGDYPLAPWEAFFIEEEKRREQEATDRHSGV